MGEKVVGNGLEILDVAAYISFNDNALSQEHWHKGKPFFPLLLPHNWVAWTS